MRHCPNPSCEHFLRYGTIAEFRATIEVCSDCGTTLVGGEAPQPSPAKFRELVTVYKASDGIRAHLLRSVLEGEDIDVFIRGEALLGAVGELPATLLDVEVQVPPESAVRARELALQWESDRSSES
jgi:hypothetical protein